MSKNTQPTLEKRAVWILGAGLAGSLLATLLSKRGFSVSLSEKRSSVELEQLAAGRSINLALAERGRYALECAGFMAGNSGERIVDAVLAQAIAMPGRQVHISVVSPDRQDAFVVSPDRRDLGSENFQAYSACGTKAIWSVHRARLNRTLLVAAKNAGAKAYFNERVISVDLIGKTAEIEDINGRRRIAFDLILGADGAGSVLREAIAAQQPSDVAQPFVDFLDHGYKEITIPPNIAGEFALTPNALHIWPRERFMVIALPNPDQSFTATLFLQNNGAISFAALDSVPAIEAFCQTYFPQLIALVPDLTRQIQTHPTGLLGTLHCPVWHYSDCAVLLGDAAHAIVPFHGQGMNCAFEDCVALANLMGAADSTTARMPNNVLLAHYAAARRPQAKAIAEMALENYVEMRDHVADADFRLRKALEQQLARAHPKHFVPRYELVSFSHYDYALAQTRGRWQSALLHEFCDGKVSLADVDFAAASARVTAELPKL
jgi:kynurenine 3-monooxygenase